MRHYSISTIALLGLIVAVPFAGCMKSEFSCKDKGQPLGCGVYAGASSQGGSETGGSNEGGGGVGGTNGGESSTGGTTTIPCNGACSGSKPVCNAVTNVCVECTSKTDCKDPLKPACNSANVCVGCVEGKDCSTDPLRRVCDTETSTCVGCLLLTQSCNADPFNHVCNTTTKMCVSCMTNTDCPTATASRCDTATNTCGVCQVDSDCSQVPGKTVCLTGIAGQPNQCVQCTPEKETSCGANSCNPETKECTTTPRGSRNTCQSCLADSECGDGSGVVDANKRCVPMTFNGTAHGAGGYCLKRVSAGCTNPYSVAVSAVSLSGALSEPYCGVNQAVTNCEAVLDLVASKTCIVDTECGGGQGGLCKAISIVAPANRCTIPCGKDDQCPSGSTCSQSDGTGWCQ